MPESMSLTQYARMRVADTVRSWLGNWPASEFPNVFGGSTTPAGISVDEYSILNYAPVYACVNVISGDVGSLPLNLNKVEKDGSKEPFVSHPLYELLHDRPNPEMSSMVWRETGQAHALTWGNGYAEIERDGANRPVAIWPITPDRVTVLRENRRLRYRVSQPNGGQVYLDPMNILHVPGMGYNGIMGYSVVSLARDSLALGMATERFGATFFGNGSSFGGVISFKREKMDQEFKQGVRESIGAMHTGVDRAHKFLLLGNQAKYERLGIPPNDAQFLETRRFQIAEVARWFGGIPLHKLGDLERATFSNIEQQDIEYYKSCLRRWLVRWEQELNYKLISPLERRYQRIEFNVEGLLRGDSAARASFYSTMFNIGAYSINMILEKENMNKIGPEGDVHYVPANLIAAEIAMEGPQPPKVTVEEVPPKQLEAGQSDEAQRAMLAELVKTTAAIETTILAERTALSDAERLEHQQALARLETDRFNIQLAFDEYRTKHAADMETAEQETAAERAARAEAESVRAAAAQETADARAQRDAAEQRATDATQARAAAEATAQAQKAAELDRLTQVMTAHRALLVQAVKEQLVVEVDRARRRQATPEQFTRWLESFYQQNRDVYAEKLYPIALTVLAWKRSTEDPHAVAGAWAQAHCETSQQQLRTVLEESSPEAFHVSLDRLLTRWEQERPQQVADQVLHDEITYIRNYR